MSNHAILDEFFTHTKLEDLPAEVIEKAKLILLDTIGVAIAGSHARAAGITRDLLAEFPMNPAESILWGQSEKTSCLWASLANAMAASCLDADDGHRRAKGHLAGVVVPVVVAAGERIKASGTKLLESLIVGYELGIRVGALFNKDEKLLYYGSGTWASIGAAAAAAKIMGLNGDACFNALGIAEVNTPLALIMRWINLRRSPEVKEGMSWAALTGLSAALLAEKGLVGTFTLIHQEAGRAIIDNLGSHYEILNSYFKLYPSCRWSHPAIDAILNVLAEHRLTTDQVDRILIATHAKGCLLDNPRPEISEQAQYSIPFLVGAALVYGRVSPSALSEKCLTDSRVLTLAERVTLTCDPQLDAKFPEKTMARVTIKTNDQKTIQIDPQQWTRGDCQNPLTRDELIQKFFSFTESHLPEAMRHKIVASVMDLENIGCTTELTNLLAPQLSK